MPKAKSPSKKAAGANGDAGANGTAIDQNQKTPKSALRSSFASDSNSSNEILTSRATDTSVHPSVSEEQIRRRAYELYVQRGGVGGNQADDWLRAEAELRGRR